MKVTVRPKLKVAITISRNLHSIKYYSYVISNLGLKEASSFVKFVVY